MTMNQYWGTDDQAWIMPVLWESSNDGAVLQASDWPGLRAALQGTLASHGAGSRTDVLLTPLDAAVASGADFKTVIAGLVDEYLAGLAHQPAPSASSAPRFVSIGPVEGYPGWWQGYDNVDRIWKSVASAETPGDLTPGWTISSQVDWNTVTREPGARTSAGPEPEWDATWRMFYRIASDGGYEFADAIAAGDRSSGCSQVWLSRAQVLARQAPAPAADPHSGVLSRRSRLRPRRLLEETRNPSGRRSPQHECRPRFHGRICG